jgi:aryl-alcohol dehydrogenase-like predicted oxidoreductase
VQYRALGPTGLKVSVVALGAAGFGRQLDAKGADPVVAAALDAGINFVDTAEAYPNSEIVLGEVLRGRRERFIVATKFNAHVGENLVKVPDSIRDIRQAIDGSLRRLKTDHVDIYYLHQPIPEQPIAETVQMMGELVRAGKVRFIAASNLSGQQIRQAAAAAREMGSAPFVAHQNHYSLVDRRAEKDSLATCRELGLGFVSFAPLVRGLLVGRYKRGEQPAKGSRMESFPGKRPDDAAYDKADAVGAFASERGLSRLQVALGGLLAHDGVTSLLVGASSAEQVRANVAAVEWTPSASDLAILDAI